MGFRRPGFQVPVLRGIIDFIFVDPQIYELAPSFVLSGNRLAKGGEADCSGSGSAPSRMGLYLSNLKNFLYLQL
jgi:hypothetical protein